MESLRILLLGSGGREHALAWKLNQSKSVEVVYTLPGNGGTASGLSKVENVNGINMNDFAAVIGFAKEKDINLVVPGPEAPLVDGIEKYCRAGKSIKVIMRLFCVQMIYGWLQLVLCFLKVPFKHGEYY